MSGGHWDYIQDRIVDIGNEINPKEKTKEEKEFGVLLVKIGNLVGTLDWAYSGDTSIDIFQDEFKAFKKEFLK